MSLLNADSIRKGLNYIRDNGISGLMSSARYKMRGPGSAYDGWYRNQHRPTESELQRQRDDVLPYRPVISIVVSVYMTRVSFLRAMLDSVRRQTYAHWELCIVDGSRGESAGTEEIIRQYAEQDSRIKYKLPEINQGISGNIDMALDMATGEYVALLDHDDVLADEALYRVACELQEKQYAVLYSDEDKLSEDGNKYLEPVFKSDFNLDLLRAYNYISGLFVVQRWLALSVGGFHDEYDGAQDYDFVLRCCERAAGVESESEGLSDRSSIKHIPHVLYHRRIHKNTAEQESRKERAREIGRRAVEEHLSRSGCYAMVTLNEKTGYNKVCYNTLGNPLVSIIISGGDSPETMKKCILPLYERVRYSNFEIIIVDTLDRDREMSSFYHKIESVRKNIKVVTNPKLVTRSEMRNFGAGFAGGDYLLFLDGNTEIIDSTAIGEMLGICMRQEVGVVGGTLYADNGTVWHSGIAVGLNAVATELYRGIRKGEFGYLMHNTVNCDYSAVFAGCMLVKRKLYSRLGGFSDKFRSELSDIDFCLRAGELGCYVVSAADAGWYYHSAGMPARDEIPKQEADLFSILWDRILRGGDPFYNPNFSGTGEPFTL